jgi:polyisoprenoid-binding protein YceI
MNKLSSYCSSLLFLLILAIAIPVSVKAQTKFHGQNLGVTINGTSNLHDWEMKSGKATCDALISLIKNKMNLSAFSFSVPVGSLKSGHDGMDKNTYKAMNSNKYPNIGFVFSSINRITSTQTNIYQVACMGKLTIAGVTKLTPLTATMTYHPADKSFTCVGTKAFRMTEYGVKPPTAVFGTIKTGDEISVSYNVTIKS